MADPRLSPSVVEVNIPDDDDDDAGGAASADSALMLPPLASRASGGSVPDMKRPPPLSPSFSLRNQLLRQNATSACSTPSEAPSPDDAQPSASSDRLLNPNWNQPPQLRASAPNVNEDSRQPAFPRALDPQPAYMRHRSQPSVFKDGKQPPEQRDEGLSKPKSQTAPDINMFDPFPRGSCSDSLDGEGVQMQTLGGSSYPSVDLQDDTDDDLRNANTLFLPHEDGAPQEYEAAAEELPHRLDSQGEEVDDDVFVCEVLDNDIEPSSTPSSPPSPEEFHPSTKRPRPTNDELQVPPVSTRRHSSPFVKRPCLLIPTHMRSSSLESPLLRRRSVPGTDESDGAEAAAAARWANDGLLAGARKPRDG
jgi:hypothetical protein